MTSPDSDAINRNIDNKEQKSTPSKTIETQATVDTSSVATGRPMVLSSKYPIMGIFGKGAILYLKIS